MSKNYETVMKLWLSAILTWHFGLLNAISVKANIFFFQTHHTVVMLENDINMMV